MCVDNVTRSPRSGVTVRDFARFRNFANQSLSEWWHSGAVVRIVASQQEGPALNTLARACFCEICIFFSVPVWVLSGSPTSSQSRAC